MKSLYSASAAAMRRAPPPCTAIADSELGAHLVFGFRIGGEQRLQIETGTCTCLPEGVHRLVEELLIRLFGGDTGQGVLWNWLFSTSLAVVKYLRGRADVNAAARQAAAERASRRAEKLRFIDITSLKTCKDHRAACARFSPVGYLNILPAEASSAERAAPPIFTCIALRLAAIEDGAAGNQELCSCFDNRGRPVVRHRSHRLTIADLRFLSRVTRRRRICPAKKE